ncbi:hypothetical protein GTN66_05665 [bacterium]|nr:hypothetical protein [bacterium]NIO73887.1 hypothetical protein [bacterium]
MDIATMVSILSVCALGALIAWFFYSSRRPEPPINQFLIGGQQAAPEDLADLRRRAEAYNRIRQEIEQVGGQGGE